MLKKRVIACLVVRNGIVVQSIQFKKYLPVGKPAIAVEFLNQWGIDEIVLLDITASRENRGPDFATIKSLSTKCYVPLTVGGGITHIDEVDVLMDCGADKFSINRTALERPSFITEAAHKYGNQCVVVPIDVIRDENNNLRVFDHVNRRNLDLDPITWAKQVEDLGAGEVFVTSVDRDGTYRGYDIDLIQKIADEVNLPVIASGGAGSAEDFAQAFATKATGASAANFFHFSEHSVIVAKSLLRRSQPVPVRLETYADYSDSSVDDDHRLLKKDDRTLEDMRFIRIEKEVI